MAYVAATADVARDSAATRLVLLCLLFALAMFCFGAATTEICATDGHNREGSLVFVCLRVLVR
eukprot:11788224-Alexandrium_andersonii.AAC.1